MGSLCVCVQASWHTCNSHWELKKAPSYYEWLASVEMHICHYWLVWAPYVSGFRHFDKLLISSHRKAPDGLGTIWNVHGLVWAPYVSGFKQPEMPLQPRPPPATRRASQSLGLVTWLTQSSISYTDLSPCSPNTSPPENGTGTHGIYIYIVYIYIYIYIYVYVNC